MNLSIHKLFFVGLGKIVHESIEDGLELATGNGTGW